MYDHWGWRICFDVVSSFCHCSNGLGRARRPLQLSVPCHCWLSEASWDADDHLYLLYNLLSRDPRRHLRDLL